LSGFILPTLACVLQKYGQLNSSVWFLGHIRADVFNATESIFLFT